MSHQHSQSSHFKTYVRWRPLSPNESSTAEIGRSVDQYESTHSISLSFEPHLYRPRTWKSGASFTEVFEAGAMNSSVFEGVVAPTLPRVMDGATCNFFAYGHSGSGKTHTIIGYNNEVDEQLGLALSASRDLFRALDEINIKLGGGTGQGNSEQDLGVAVRLYEIRGKLAVDLFNNNAECHVREGPDGQTHIRGKTEVLEDGKVRVRPIVAHPCCTIEELHSKLRAGLEMRKTGSSSVHDESSRTHAILEFEVVNKALLDARDAVIERESELVPVGKRATDVHLEEHKNAYIQTPEGKYTRNPDHTINQGRIDAAEAEKSEYETRLQLAEAAVVECFKSCQHSCLGGKFVFVDLAGSEYFVQGNDASVVGPKQTSQERQQGRQINADLFALKEVIRACALNHARIPFRSSPLTMVLRSHFLGSRGGLSAMILTVSPSEAQASATLSTLKYGNLVAVAGAVGKK
ncbi:P-loop containing nucleoside triphosphate hydrolase protein [Melanomma pulvis-pyrius CBS 109.77]|uniref:Kinesin-like protein n=1 Tax=Melanomma pulvis-pyrius CBS 109.77 TaxID=1314802 RepID=A0A6A6XRZ0_9PLEO|nr:P-loop containing nucleoside triphosphate hydrolase protein [Melanomma pulvis-pyrius CBS 109.77]